MSLRSQLRFGAALMGTNLKAALALREAFWMGAIFMVANNILFFGVWWIFFARFEDIRGWRIGDVAVLYGIVAAGCGVAVVFAGGVRDLARTIVDGDLDPFMTQPKNLLLYVVASKSVSSGWGDIGSGIAFVAYSGEVSLYEWPLALLAIAISASVFCASGIILHSFAFWLGRVETLARTLWEFLITFSLYPSPLFGGGLKLLLFTVVPAGFIGHLPAALVRDFSWTTLAAATGGAVGWCVLAWVIFHAGLRRYESGNRFGVRA